MLPRIYFNNRIASLNISSARQTGAVAGDITMAIREDIVASAVSDQIPLPSSSTIADRVQGYM